MLVLRGEGQGCDYLYLEKLRKEGRACYLYFVLGGRDLRVCQVIQGVLYRYLREEKNDSSLPEKKYYLGKKYSYLEKKYYLGEQNIVIWKKILWLSKREKKCAVYIYIIILFYFFYYFILCL